MAPPVKVGLAPAVTEIAAGCVTMTGSTVVNAGCELPNEITDIEYAGNDWLNVLALNVNGTRVMSAQPVPPGFAASSLGLP